MNNLLIDLNTSKIFSGAKDAPSQLHWGNGTEGVETSHLSTPITRRIPLPLGSGLEWEWASIHPTVHPTVHRMGDVTPYGGK